MEKVIDRWRWFVTLLDGSNFEKLRQEVDDLGVYDLHNILHQQKKVEWCEWHLNINENDKAIKIAEEFHQNFKKLKLSSSIVGQVDTIEETFLKFMPKKNDDWKRIRKYFKEAREQDNPLAIVKAYTVSKDFSQRLNKHSAVNTYHALKLYCTLLNCPVLAQTQEYTEAFTRILFHPKLEQYLYRKGTVYRGIGLKDKKLVDNYNEEATIITTTFLSTSTDPGVADIFGGTDSENAISVSCIYNINNTNRHTALNLRNLSAFPNEEEILILRYVPFTIRSVKRMENGRRMEICFDECNEEYTVEENRF